MRDRVGGGIHTFSVRGQVEWLGTHAGRPSHLPGHRPRA